MNQFIVKWCRATCKICAPAVPFVNRCTDLAVNCEQLNCNQKRIAEKFCRKSCKTCDFDLSRLFNDPDQDDTALCLEHRLCRKLDSYVGSLKTIFCQNERLQTLCPSTCGFCERTPEGNRMLMSTLGPLLRLCLVHIIFRKLSGLISRLLFNDNYSEVCTFVRTAGFV